MISLNPAPTFPADVDITEPGATDTLKVAFVFKHKGRKELDEFISRPAKAKEAGQELKDPEYLGEIVVAWPGVDAPFTPENFATFLEQRPASGHEIYRAYLRALTESRVKN